MNNSKRQTREIGFPLATSTQTDPMVMGESVGSVSPPAQLGGTSSWKTVQFLHQTPDPVHPTTPDTSAEITALASEEALSKIWDTPEEDEAWRDL